jgi:hypothetical protein
MTFRRKFILTLSSVYSLLALGDINHFRTNHIRIIRRTVMTLYCTVLDLKTSIVKFYLLSDISILCGILNFHYLVTRHTCDNSVGIKSTPISKIGLYARKRELPPVLPKKAILNGSKKTNSNTMPSRGEQIRRLERIKDRT